MSIEKKDAKDSQAKDTNSYYTLAKNYEKNRETSQAILYINKLLHSDPEHSLGKKMREALFYKHKSSRKIDFNKKKIAEQAIKKYSEHLKTTLAPLEKSQVYRQIGDGYLTLALYDVVDLCLCHYNNALLAYTKALDFNGKDETIYYGRGKVYFDLLQYYEAIHDFTNGIKINPEEGRLYNIRCNVYVFLKEDDLALQDARLALKYNPNQTYALQVLNKFGTEDEVISACLAMLKLEPTHPQAKHFFEKKIGKPYKAYQEEKAQLAESLCRFGLLSPRILNTIIAEYAVGKAPNDKKTLR